MIQLQLLARPSSSMLRRGLPSPSSVRPPCYSRRRTFFASSTDHTRLLQEAEVHRLQADKKGVVYQYVLVDYGMDLATVQKVPQLHLGRLSLDTATNTIHGVKVVNKTLGDCQDVCGKLLEAALQDAHGDNIQGLATLHGVSEYALKQQQPDAVSPSVQAIAKNEAKSTTDNEAWEKICLDFVKGGRCSEAKLYQEHGGTLSHILHDADTGDYANTCAGSMAVFTFRK